MLLNHTSGDRLTGMYRGQVVKHEKDGYVKVYVPGVYLDEYRYQPEYLPKAELAVDLFGGGTSSDNFVHYPNIGAMVWVFFANEDQNYPVVWAVIPGGKGSIALFNKSDINQCPDKYDTDENLLKHDFKKRHPLSRQRHGRAVIDTYYDGKVELRGERHMNVPTDCNVDAYSYSMHTYNWLINSGFFTKQYPLSNAWFVYENDNSNKPVYVPIIKQEYDEEKYLYDDRYYFDQRRQQIAIRYESLFNLNHKCIGLSCVFKTPVNNEQQFMIDLEKKMTCQSGNGNAITLSVGLGDTKTLWHNYMNGGPTPHPRPGIPNSKPVYYADLTDITSEDQAGLPGIKATTGIRDGADMTFIDALNAKVAKIVKQMLVSRPQSHIQTVCNTLAGITHKVFKDVGDDDELTPATTALYIAQITAALSIPMFPAPSDSSDTTTQIAQSAAALISPEATQMVDAANAITGVVILETNEKEAIIGAINSIFVMKTTKGMSSVFINMDGTDKKRALELCKATDCGAYICNGAQYGHDPLYFDEYFNDSYPVHCPLLVIPGKTIPDVDAYDVNIILFDPCKVYGSINASKDGTVTQKTFNSFAESYHTVKYDGEGKIHEESYRQQTEGQPYKFIQENLSSFQAYRHDFDVSKGVSSLNKWYSISEDKSNILRLSCANVQLYHAEGDNCPRIHNKLSSYACLLSTMYVKQPKPSKEVQDGYVNEEGLTRPSHELGILKKEVHLSSAYDISRGTFVDAKLSTGHCPQKGVRKKGSHKIISSDMEFGPIDFYYNMWKDYDGLVEKIISAKLNDFDGKATIYCTDELDLTIRIRENPTDYAHIQFNKDGKILLDTSRNIEATVYDYTWSGPAPAKIDPPFLPSKIITLADYPIPVIDGPESEVKKMRSHILMDCDGNIKIESVNSIMLSAPTIVLNGTTYNAEFTDMTTKANTNSELYVDTSTKANTNSEEYTDMIIKSDTITENGSTVNITGGSGDCVIDGTSLNTHTHSFVHESGTPGVTLQPTV